LEDASTFIQTLEDTPPFLLLVGLGVLIVIGIGVRLAFRKPTPHLTAFAGAAGSVLVSRKALQDLIRQTCMIDEWVEAAKPTVKINGSRVDTRVELRLAAPDNLKPTCERLQVRITELLQKSLNFDEIGEIQIFVSSFGKSDLNDSKQKTIDLTPKTPEPATPPSEAETAEPDQEDPKR